MNFYKKILIKTEDGMQKGEVIFVQALIMNYFFDRTSTPVQSSGTPFTI